MEVSTVNTLITVCATLLASWMGLQVKKYADESVLPKKSIYGRTLSDVFVPILNALNEINRYTWDEQEKLLITLLHDKQVLIPPALAAQMQHALLSDDARRESALQGLNNMTEAYANWYRKHLGYPYDPKKIDKRYTANTQRNEAIKNFTLLFLAVVWMLCTLYTVFAIMYLSEHNHTAELTPWNIAPTLIALFGIPFVAIRERK